MSYAERWTDLPRRLRDSTVSRRTALKNGVRHAYIGNVSDRGRASTYCYNCNALLIGRDRYTLTYWGLSKTGACQQCGTPCAGVFDAVPGAWGAKRLPVRMRDFNAEPAPTAPA